MIPLHWVREIVGNDSNEIDRSERSEDDRHVHASQILRWRILSLFVENNFAIYAGKTIEAFERSTEESLLSF